MSYLRWNSGSIRVLALLSAAVMMQACGDDENPRPSDDGPVIGAGRGGSGSAGSSGKGGSGAVGGDDSDAGSGAGGDETTGGTAGTAGIAGIAGEGGGGHEPVLPSCESVNADGCYAECTPVEDIQFLNRCSASDCSAFDNAERIPGWNGSLPDLQ